MRQTIRLPQHVWFEPKEVDYTVPDGWDVTTHNIAGYNKTALKPDHIRATIQQPLGMQPLREIAKGRQEVVIIFDDLTRCTSTHQFVPYILEELRDAGIADSQIRFIAAVANHHALTRIDMVKKLGEDVVARFPVYNHCPFLNCRDIGTTSFGTKAEINAEVMHCDLKICVGQIVPHPIYGLSGGGKMIMPGVSSFESVKQHHGATHSAWKQGQTEKGPGGDAVDANPSALDALEIARMAGVDMIVNATVNRIGEPVAVFAGALDVTYGAAVKEAKAHYVAVNTADNDIVFANNFIKASEFMVPLAACSRAARRGGTVVVVDNSPSGQVVHYLFDNFGSTIAGDLFNPIQLALHLRSVLIYNEFPEGRLRSRFASLDRVQITDRWEEIIGSLERTYGGQAKVAVYPNADTQYFRE
jgi:lactate racemase